LLIRTLGDAYIRRHDITFSNLVILQNSKVVFNFTLKKRGENCIIGSRLFIFEKHKKYC